MKIQVIEVHPADGFKLAEEDMKQMVFEGRLGPVLPDINEQGFSCFSGKVISNTGRLPAGFPVFFLGVRYTEIS